MEKATQLFKALSDKSRLRILSSLKDGPMYVELLSQRLELAPSTISFHLKKLEECGLVSSTKEQYYVVFSLNKMILESKITDLIDFSDEDIKKQDKREEDYRKKVIETFFEGCKLNSIPVQKEKRRIILEKILKGFKIDKEYKEKEVNIMLADINDDFVTLRRELVKADLLIESKGYYKVNANEENKKIRTEVNTVSVIEDMLLDKEKIIYKKDDGFILDIKGVVRNIIKDEVIFITSRGRIITYQVIAIKGFELSKYIFSYNFSQEDDKDSKSFIENIFDKGIFQDNKKITYNIIDDEVVCYGRGLKVRQESNQFGMGATMNITFNLTLEEFRDISRKISVDIFEEEIK